MKILVLNGSPKGDYSATLQTAKYLEIKFPEHTFEYLNVGSKIKSLEKDFTPVVCAVERAEMVIFSYPVYTFIAPSQLHRCIELMKEHGVSLAGKSVTQITTSKHFYDVTAHRYIADNCFDLGANVIKGLSADMDDLTKAKGQREAVEFFKHAIYATQQGIFEQNKNICTPKKSLPVTPIASNEKTKGDVVIVCDLAEDDEHLKDMIARFRGVLPRATRIVNLRDFPFKGGCISCFNCATDGKCIYTDGFDKFLREQLQTGEAIVYAFNIKDHSMGSLFKLYDDRQFCNGHRTVTMGMPFGYLISGNYSEEYNLQMVIEGRAEVGGNYLAGVATDEYDPDKAIDDLAKNLDYAIENKYVQPSNFLGVGGMKIFRDLIFMMRGLMRADHKFYKSHGQYDFPQKKKGTIAFMYLAGAMMSNKKIKAKLGNKLNEGMLMPYTKVLEKARKEKE